MGIYGPSFRRRGPSHRWEDVVLLLLLLTVALIVASFFYE
jgi:hypothetical protein